MNKKSRRMSLVAGALALTMLGAACSGSMEDEAAAPAPAETQAPAATQAPAPAPAETQAPAATEAPATDETQPPAEAPAELGGEIALDGSSTVAPLLTLAAEDFMAANSGVQVTVGTSGTGGGFEKFCNGETDISNASRAIKDEEAAACAAKGIEFVEVIVANDALSVVVSPENDWANCLTVDQLKKIWEPAAEGTVTNWNQVDTAFPDQKLELYGPGTDSGTFDYFTKEINGEEGASRTDYSPSENDNNTITGISGSAGSMGYLGLSYIEENADKLKAIAVDGGSGCVDPSSASVQDGTYVPLSRPLFIYISKAAGDRPEVKAFAEFYAAEQDTLTEEALYVPLDAAQKATQADAIAGL